MIYITLISVESLGCWGESESDRAISGDYGVLDMKGCYDKAKSLGYSVFAMNNHSNCYTSPSAWITYKKYGQIPCNKPRAIEVYQIRKGIIVFIDLREENFCYMSFPKSVVINFLIIYFRSI